MFWRWGEVMWRLGISVMLFSGGLITRLIITTPDRKMATHVLVAFGILLAGVVLFSIGTFWKGYAQGFVRGGEHEHSSVLAQDGEPKNCSWPPTRTRGMSRQAG